MMRYIELNIKGKCFQIRAEEKGAWIWFHVQGNTFVIRQTDQPLSSRGSCQAQDQARSSFGEGCVLSPMPGRIIKVSVDRGQVVKKDQVLLILSSMKMEYIIRAPVKSLVQSIKVREGDQVSLQDVLVELKRV